LAFLASPIFVLMLLYRYFALVAALVPDVLSSLFSKRSHAALTGNDEIAITAIMINAKNFTLLIRETLPS